MSVVLWVLQGLLALVFLGAGATKATQPRERLETSMSWVEGVSTPLVRLLGTVEVLGAIGLVAPAATGIAPVLTPLAAAGLGVTMIGAIVVHARHKEPQGLAVSAVLLVLAVVVAWGRFGPYAL